MIQRYSILARLILASAELWQRESTSGLVPEDYQGQDEEFEDLLRDWYKLEYVYSMLMNKPFKGNAARKNNILKHVIREFQEVNSTLGAVIAEVFKYWLSLHAINEPYAWAAARVGEGWEEGFESIWVNTLWEYIRYHPKFQHNTRDPRISTIAEQALLREIEQKPYMKEFLFEFVGGKEAFIEAEGENAVDEWLSDPEDVTDRLNLPADATDEEVREAAEIRAEESDISEYIGGTISDGINDLDPDDAERFLIAVNEHFVFPLWFEKWEAEGIVETRENIEDLYARLLNPPQELGKHYALVNEALHASHQGGKMLDYLEDYVGSSSLNYFLTSLSEGKFTAELDNILRKAGVQV